MAVPHEACNDQNGSTMDNLTQHQNGVITSECNQRRNLLETDSCHYNPNYAMRHHTFRVKRF